MNQDILDALSDAQEEQGYLKAGFLGFPKSGKTYTACLLAIAVQRHFGEPGSIAMFDTEGGSVYLRPTVFELTGKKLVAKRARSFDDLMSWANACIDARVSVGIVDSITHPWRELCDAYLAQVNERRASRRQSKQTKLEFQDWGVLKTRWARWTDFYLNAPMHIIIAGRAGYEYDMEERDDGSGRKDLIKSGIKMKTEAEFGFEPSLLVSMEAEQVMTNGKRSMVRQATVLGDRFARIDGKRESFASTGHPEEALIAVYDFFKPHLDCLTIGSHATIDTNLKTDFALNEDGDDNWAAERRLRTILAEEIQGELLKHFPGQSVADKKAKADLIDKHFGTRSWTKIESMSSDLLRRGLIALRQEMGTAAAGEERREREPGEEG